jgi:hypothetical protein
MLVWRFPIATVRFLISDASFARRLTASACPPAANLFALKLTIFSRSRSSRGLVLGQRVAAIPGDKFSKKRGGEGFLGSMGVGHESQPSQKKLAENVQRIQPIFFRILGAFRRGQWWHRILQG